jgi:transcriptional regulator with XRE-family HTH domain
MIENCAMDIAFGDAIRAARQSLGVKQEDLADRVGMKRSQLSRLENGNPKNPGVPTRQRLAAGLGISVDEVMRIGRDYIESSPMVVEVITEHGRRTLGSEHMDVRLRLKRLIDVVEWDVTRENEISEKLWEFAREDAQRRSQ